MTDVSFRLKAVFATCGLPAPDQSFTTEVDGQLYGGHFVKADTRNELEDNSQFAAEHSKPVIDAMKTE